MQNEKTRLGQVSGPFCFPASAADGNAPSRETDMKVNVYLSERDAIRAGVNGGMHAVEIDAGIMSQAERDYLANALKTGSDGISYISGPTEPYAMSLLVWVRWEMAEVAKKAAVKAAAKAEATKAWLDCPDEKLVELCSNRTVRVRNGWTACGATCAMGETGIDDADPAVAAKLDRIKETARQIEARLAKEHAETQAKLQAAQSAAEKAMLEWAKEHGTELLRERVAGGYNWRALARREYAQSVAAAIGGEWMVEPEAWSCESWDNPTLAAIKSKKAVLAKVPVVTDGPGLRDCQILLVKVETEDGECDKFPALRIEVACPDGTMTDLVRKLD